MIFRRRREPGVYLPWERKKGFVGALARTRIRQVLIAVAVVMTIVFLRRREEYAAKVRSTRASIATATRALFAYRADHTSECPRVWADVVAEGYARRVPLDAWGRPLRLVCPGRRDPQSFDVLSDGPDGLPYGLDRIE